MTASARQPSWGEVLDTVLTSRLRGVHTAMVGTIQSYSEPDQTATVTLAVELEATRGAFEAVPPLSEVPVAWPGAWSAGDTCLLVFCEESFAKWFETGSVEPPDVLRRHGLHAVCFPFAARGGQPAQFVALANLVDARLSAMQTAFDAHVHAVPSLGTSAVPVTLIGEGTSVAAAKVKAR